MNNALCAISTAVSSARFYSSGSRSPDPARPVLGKWFTWRMGFLQDNYSKSGTERAEKTMVRPDEWERWRTCRRGGGGGMGRRPARYCCRCVCETSDCTALQSHSNRIDEDGGSPVKKHSEIMITKIKDFESVMHWQFNARRGVIYVE